MVRKFRVGFAAMVGVLGILAVLVLLVVPGGQVEARDVQSSEMEAPLFAGGVAHTQTVEVSQVYVTSWDYIDIQVKNVVTGSQVLTVTPQFSNQTGVACSGVTDWYAATHYGFYESDAATDTLVWLGKSYQFTMVGSTQTARSIPVTGRCFQIKLEVSSGTYTPTYYYRLYNWDN